MAEGNRRHVLRRFPCTSAALALALVVVLAGLVGNIDVFEAPTLVIPGIAPGEMGEVGIAFVLVLPAWVVDYVIDRRRQHDAHLLPSGSGSCT